MKTSRRRFIQQAGGFSLLLGFPSIGCRSAPAPDWLAEGLKKMRAENKPGVVVRIPSEKKDRCALGHQLVFYMNSASLDVQELFCEAVFMCLESRVVDDHIAGARATENVILIDPDGYAQAGIPALCSGKPFETADFVATMRDLLHGPTNKLLNSREEAIRATLPAEVVRAVDSGSDPALLEKKAMTIMPLLIRARLEAGTPERANQLRKVIANAFAAATVKKAGPRLPFGVAVQAQSGGCGDTCKERDVSLGIIACGMGRFVPNAREFVKFLT